MTRLKLIHFDGNWEIHSHIPSICFGSNRHNRSICSTICVVINFTISIWSFTTRSLPVKLMIARAIKRCSESKQRRTMFTCLMSFNTDFDRIIFLRNNTWLCVSVVYSGARQQRKHFSIRTFWEWFTECCDQGDTSGWFVLVYTWFTWFIPSACKPTNGYRIEFLALLKINTESHLDFQRWIAHKPNRNFSFRNRI